MLKSFFQMSLSIALLGLVGCMTIQRPFDYDHDLDFTEMKTFNWYPDPEVENAEGVKNTFVEKRFKRAIQEELRQKGLTRDTNTPDILVNYHVTVREKEYTSVRSPEWYFHGSFHHGHHHGHSYHCGFPYYPQRYSYDEATIVIDMVSASNNELIWRGWTAQRSYGPSLSETAIAKSVQDILLNFPPN